MSLTKLDVADIVRSVIDIRDRCDAILHVLLPDADTSGCPHPADQIEDLSTLDDDGESYRCGRCGAEQKLPFHVQE